jgi:hypothetical protein
MSSPGQAVPASSADDMPFTADKIARLKVMHITAYFLNSADKLMTNNYGWLYRLSGPGVPVENMNISATN